MEHYYCLTDGQLIYRCSKSDFESRLDLRRAEYTVKQRRKFHRLWYAGLIAVATPFWTEGVIYLKERSINLHDLRGAACIHGVLLVIGILLLLFYRRRMAYYEVKTRRGEKLWIFMDRVQPDTAECFVQALRQMSTVLSQPPNQTH